MAGGSDRVDEMAKRKETRCKFKGSSKMQKKGNAFAKPLAALVEVAYRPCAHMQRTFQVQTRDF